MAYQIKYAYTCHIGKIRNNNEDNFWCCGEFLNAQNQGMSHIQSGCRKQSELPVMAVFDGMGGESCGEMAAFLAAESCGIHYKEQKPKKTNTGGYYEFKNKNRCTSHEGNYLYSPVHLSRHFAGSTAYIYVSPEKQRNFLIKEHFLSTGHLHFTAYFGR